MSGGWRFEDGDLRGIARWEGALFLFYYGVYTLYLIMNATGHDALPAFSKLLLLIVLPLTAATLLAGSVRHLRNKRSIG